MRSHLSVKLVAIMLLFLGGAKGAIAQSSDTLLVIDTVAILSITQDSLRSPANFDEQLLVDINSIGNDTLPTLDFAMSAFTHSIYATTVVVPAGLYALGWGNDDHDMASTGMNTVISEIVAGLTTTIAKQIIQRDRPYVTLKGVRIPTGKEIGTSFPSGHSSVAWALSTSLMIGYPKWYVIVPAALYATTVSFSRPFVGVHYPTDILVGAVLGVGSAFLVKALEPGITKAFPSLFPEKKATGELMTIKIATIRISL
jgi:membrane-associated phospholipid phosphatase